MGFFDFLKKKKKVAIIDKSNWTGKDFEFLIVGDFEIPAETYDSIMTPNSVEWKKILRGGSPYYQIGQDEFSYSHEIPGIQMTYNDEISFEKAKLIANEIIGNINSLGHNASLLTIDKGQVYSF